MSSLREVLKIYYGKTMSKANIHLVLKNRFYIGLFDWAGKTYQGTHLLFIDPNTFAHVQAVLAGNNRPKYSKRDVAFRGLMSCAHDGCMLTGDVQKEKCAYYRCTSHRGKCDLPRFREEEVADRLRETLKGIQVPPEVVEQIVATLLEDQKQAEGKVSAEQARLESRLSVVRNRMDAAYVDKLDGRIPEDFWDRKMSEWRMEEHQVKMAIGGLAEAETSDKSLDAKKVLELANKAYSLYSTQNSFEKAHLLRKLCSNFSLDAVSTTPAYRYPFNLIFERAKGGKWSGRLDSNQRPHPPQGCALPG